MGLIFAGLFIAVLSAGNGAGGGALGLVLAGFAAVILMARRGFFAPGRD